MDTKEAIEKYSQKPIIRALVQAIPYVGGSIDTFIFEKSAKWRDERLGELFNSINLQLESNQERLEVLENKTVNIINDEDFYDSFLFAVNAAIKTKSKEKINRFSNIISNLILDDGLLEKAKVGLMLEILNDLSEFEITLLSRIQRHTIQYDLFQNDLYLNAEKLKYHLESNQIHFEGFTSIPDHVKANPEELFFLNRLQSMQLIKKEPTNYQRSIAYSYGSAVQRTTSSVAFQGQLHVELTGFGEDFFKWISEIS